jgi:PAS domain S-box-containing protein
MKTTIQTTEEDLLFGALESARIGVCVTSSDERILMMTPAFATMLQLEAIDLLGRNVRCILSDRLRIPRFDELIGSDGPELAVHLSVDHGGRSSVVLIQARSFKQTEIGSCRLLTLLNIEDFGITGTKLQETRRQLEALNTSIVVADCRLPDMPIVFVNSRFKALTGYSAEDAIGRNCRFLQGEDRSQPQVSVLRSAIAECRSAYVVLRNYRRNGEAFMNELLVSPIVDGAGQLTHYVALQRESQPRY